MFLFSGLMCAAQSGTGLSFENLSWIWKWLCFSLIKKSKTLEEEATQKIELKTKPRVLKQAKSVPLPYEMKHTEMDKKHLDTKKSIYLEFQETDR